MLTLFHGDKGGVGKSFFCTCYIDALLRQTQDPDYNSSSFNVLVVDSDTRNPDVGRTFKNHLAVEYLDLKQHDAWLQLVDLLDDDCSREIIVSMPSGIGQFVENEADFLVESLRDLDQQLQIYWPINRLKDSVILLREFLSTPLAKYSVHMNVIMNGFFGEREKFTRWLASKTRADFLMFAGATESYLPELHYRVVDEVQNQPFSCATNLKYSVKIELERWMRTNYDLLLEERRVV